MESIMRMLFLFAKKNCTLPCRSEVSYTVGRYLCEPFTVMCVTERHCSEWAKYCVSVARQSQAAREKLRHRKTVFGCPACCLSVCLSVCLSACLSLCLSVCLSLWTLPAVVSPSHADYLTFWHRSLTLRRLMSYIYGAPILDVSRSHTTTQHSR